MERSSMYALQDVPGKGKGLVATNDIPKGTRILLERPVVTTPEDPQSEEWLRKHVSQQVESLHEDQRRMFLSLHNIYPYKEDAEQFLGIIRTNGLPIEANGLRGGVFLEACRINHSCDNNAQKNWNSRIERHTVHALREIFEGEEITINYLGFDSIRDVRRQKLQDKFGFSCSCRLCSLPAAESRENDKRLQRIDLLDQLVGQEGARMNFSERTLRYVDERIQLYNKQGPGDIGLPRAYLDAGQIAIANGDLERGRIFTERAVEGWRIGLGSDSDEAIKFTSLAQNPANLPLYGLSMNWKTSPGETPSELHGKDFDDWLWRRQQPYEIHQSGQLTSLRNRDIFPDFETLPHRSHPLDLFQGSAETDHSLRHWCFLGEITSSMTIHHLELTLADVSSKTTPLHFYTTGLGRELTDAEYKTGYTVAVLYAKRQTFAHDAPGIKLVDLKMLKIFPVSLKRLLQLSDCIQQFSAVVHEMRTCHGCSKKTASMKRCAQCSLFWYCDKACQSTSWVERGHKSDCRMLRDLDLRGLFALDWDALETPVRFPLHGT